MSRVPVDLRKVAPAGSFTTYPPGLYAFSVRKAEIQTAKTSGESKLGMQLEILIGPDGSTEYIGGTLLHSHSLSPQSFPFLKATILACGVTDEMLDGNNGTFMTEWLVGKKIQARVSTRTYQGREFNSLNDIGAYGEEASGTPSFSAPPPAAFTQPAGFAPPPPPPPAAAEESVAGGPTDSCGDCGVELAPGAKFCASCGARTAPPNGGNGGGPSAPKIEVVRKQPAYPAPPPPAPKGKPATRR